MAMGVDLLHDLGGTRAKSATQMALVDLSLVGLSVMY